MAKGCLPCLVHAEHIPLKQLVDPLLKERKKITDDDVDDDAVDSAWDNFEKALDRLKIESGEYLDDIEVGNGIYEFYFKDDYVFARKRKV